MKRVFGKVEMLFNILYLLIGLLIGIVILIKGSNHPDALLGSLIVFTLIVGDSFHLVPRILTILSSDKDKYLKSLGVGKMITSITMTIFYVLLWHFFIGVTNLSKNTFSITDYIVFIPTIIIYLLAFVRIILCLLPQNEWTLRFPPVKWGIYRNIPFVIMGLIISFFAFIYRNNHPDFSYAWLSITLSFMFYLPVVLWANKKPAIGMFMLPKTCAYVSLLIMILNVTIN